MAKMADHDDVDRVARDMIQRHGRNAAQTARGFAETADEQGDMLSAETWRDIADAIERLSGS